MVLQTTIDEYKLLLALSLATMALKLALGTMLAQRIVSKRRRGELVGLPFLKAFALVIFSLAVSRLIFIYFDFVATGFDVDKYYQGANPWIWKTASVLMTFAIGVLMYSTDKYVFRKGLYWPSVATFALGVVVFLYPVHDINDFNLVSILEAISFAGFLFVIYIFFWIGLKTPGLRGMAWSISFGLIIFAFGAGLMNSVVVTIVAPDDENIRAFLYIIATALKMTGLVVMSLGVRSFGVEN